MKLLGTFSLDFTAELFWLYPSEIVRKQTFEHYIATY